MSDRQVSMAMRDFGAFPGTAGYLWRTINTDIGLAWTFIPASTGTPGVDMGWTFDFNPVLNPTIPVPLPTDVTQLRYMDPVPLGWSYFTPILSNAANGVPGFGPAPVVFEFFDVNMRSQHMSGELMYTYRAHPFAWGAVEFLAGARYWDFEDRFGLFGTNDSIDVAGNPFIAGATNRALRSLTVNARANNRVFGPQVGMKVSRQNARWTFGAEGRLTAGINTQRVQTSGNLQPMSGVGFVVLGTLGNNLNFNHTQTRTFFSPIGELRFTADFQLTNAVSLFGAVDGMVADNIARGVRVTDYVLQQNGTIFGIRGNDRNTTIAVYGVEAGIKVNR